MQVLITGGAGFVGSHLAERLIKQGHSVVVVDNFITGRPENVAHLLGEARFTLLHYNVCNYLHVDGPLDLVLHFASPASPQDYLEHPIATLKVGALGTLQALGLAKAKQARFLLASTSEVYGDPLVSPQSEAYWGNVNPISPRGVYDEAKRYAEAMTMAYHRYHGVDSRVVRIFNTYGPRMRPNDGRVVSNFIVQALTHQPLTIYGDGSQTRSFCYVDDLVRGILALAMTPSDRQPAERTDRAFLTTRSEGTSIHEPVNIGNPTEMTVRQIAERVLSLTGSTGRIIHLPLPVDDPKVRRPDISKATRLLRWTPEVSLDEGLERTIAYFRGVVGQPASAGLRDASCASLSA